MDGGDEMIHGLSEEEKFKVIRPMLGEHMLSGKVSSKYFEERVYGIESNNTK